MPKPQSDQEHPEDSMESRRLAVKRNIQTIVMLSQSWLFRRCIALSLGRLPNYYTPHCVVPEISFCQGEGHLESMREEGSGAVISLGRRLTLRFL